MKTSITTLAILSSFIFSAATKAEEVTLPVIKAPSVLLEEGTQRNLSLSQINELLPWAKNSKVFLSDLLDNLQGITSQDKRDRLVDGIKEVVQDSGSNQSELFMRYVLNRAVVVEGLLEKEMIADAQGTIDAKVRLLVESVKMSLRYYDTDMSIMAKKTTAPYAQFGVDYFEFLKELNKSIFDASAQYIIERTALEFLQWDLYRDLNNTAFAPQIVKINNNLKMFPINKKIKDSQSIAYIRQMRGIGEQLKVRETMATSTEEGRRAFQKSEKERLEILRITEEEERIKREGPITRLVQVLAAPHINGIRFSDKSKPNGVCRALGFERAAEGVPRRDGHLSDEMMVVVNEQGEPISGDVVTNNEGFAYKDITCVDRNIKKKAIDLNFVHAANNGLLDKMSITSNSVGVCKFLGYESGVLGSNLGNGNKVGSMAVIDENGKVSGGAVVTTSEGYSIKKVICINKKIASEKILLRVPTPSMSNTPISTNSNVIGVCKALGYSHGAEGSAVGYDMRGTMLVIDKTGTVVSTEVATSSAGLGIKEMICTR